MTLCFSGCFLAREFDGKCKAFGSSAHVAVLETSSRNMASAKILCLSQLTDDEVSSPAKLVRFCERVPAVAKTGDKYRDDELTMQRQHFMKLVSSLWRNPQMIMQSNSWLEGKLEDMKNQVTEGYFSKVSTLGALDEDWVAKYLTSKLPLNMEQLEAACEYDPEAWTQLLCWMLRATRTLKIPESCRQIAVLVLAFDLRVEAIGCRWLGLKANDMVELSTGAIKWTNIGVYEVKFNSEKTKALSVLHRPTQEVAQIPDHVFIDATFSLTFNWLDLGAKVTKKPADHLLCQFFDDNKGPGVGEVVTGNSKEFNNYATNAVAGVAQGRTNGCRLASSSSSSSSRTFKASAKAAVKRESMEKARAALEKKKNDMQNKRRLPL